MKGTSHLAVGISTGVFLADKININPIVTVGLCTLGSIIVDIDEKHSMINKVLFPVEINQRDFLKAIAGTILMLMPSSAIKYIGVILFLSIISSRVEYRFSIQDGFQKKEFHRTYFHDPIIGTIVFALPLYLLHLPEGYIIAFVVGLLTHYLMDSFTSYGLPVYLLKRKKIRMPIHFNSGNTVLEYIIILGYIGILAYAKANHINLI